MEKSNWLQEQQEKAKEQWKQDNQQFEDIIWELSTPGIGLKEYQERGFFLGKGIWEQAGKGKQVFLSADISSLPEDMDINKFAEEWKKFSGKIMYAQPDDYIYAASDLCKELIASGVTNKFKVNIVEHPLLDPGQMMIAGPIVEKHKQERRDYLKQTIECCGYVVNDIEEIVQGKGPLEIKYKKEAQKIEYYLFDKEKPRLYLLMEESPLPFGEFIIYKNNPVVVKEGYFD